MSKSCTSTYIFKPRIMILLAIPRRKLLSLLYTNGNVLIHSKITPSHNIIYAVMAIYMVCCLCIMNAWVLMSVCIYSCKLPWQYHITPVIPHPTICHKITYHLLSCAVLHKGLDISTLLMSTHLHKHTSRMCCGLGRQQNAYEIRCLCKICTKWELKRHPKQGIEVYSAHIAK